MCIRSKYIFMYLNFIVIETITIYINIIIYLFKCTHLAIGKFA